MKIIKKEKDFFLLKIVSEKAKRLVVDNAKTVQTARLNPIKVLI
tara:strand:+ start:940 stop:1071 length:132 start_codon:yes stop_codon:yes gene_type:complete